MPDKLLIVESPAKAKTISKILGQNFIIASTLGHIRDLPQNSLGINIEKNFEPYYEILPERRKIVSQIKEYLKKAKDVYLATDPDREGEAIAWHITQSAKIENAKRIVFHEITADAIIRALNSPRKIDENLVNAQQARRILDRLVGYKISPYLWKKIKKGLSAGRVQSVALRLIIEREKEIENFIPQEYWNITATFCKEGNTENQFSAKLIEKNNEKIRIETKEQAQNILNDLENAKYIVKEIKITSVKKNPPPPFITSTLQQEASKKFGFSPSKTMLLAQRLYEGIALGKEGETGLITYHRTDSVNISDVARENGKNYIRQKYGNEYVEEAKRMFKSAKSAQQAHEAIRPTNVFYEPDNIKKYLTPDLYKLYKLIHTRFVASLMTSAKFTKTEVNIQANEYLFQAKGEQCLFLGYKKVYDDDEEKEEGKIPELKEGEILTLLNISPSQHFTQPPPRYTEATLVRALEEKGIGRPSTYAPIIEILKKRRYVKREGKTLYPTQLGKATTDILVQNFSTIMDVDFTAKMEDNMDKIEEGKVDWKKVLSDFYKPFSETLSHAYHNTEKIKIEPEVTDITCEKCGKQMVVREGRWGKFLACQGYPACKNVKPEKDNSAKTNIKCPRDGCGGEIVKRKSKKGRFFYGCSKYPECKFTTNKLPEN